MNSRTSLVILTNKPNSQRPQNSVSLETNSLFRVINIFPRVCRAEQLQGKMHFLPLGEKPHFSPAPSQRIVIISNRIHIKCRNTQQYDLSEGITWDSKKNIFKPPQKILKSFCKLSWQSKLFRNGREGNILQGSASPLPTEQTNTPVSPPLSLFPIVSSFRAESFSEVLI